MLQLQEYIPADLAFAWVGAFCGFIAFQNFIGNDLALKVYKSFGEGKGLGPVKDSRIAGAANSLNYIIQLLVAVLGGGYATGTVEARTGVSIHGNYAIIATMATIWLWSKVFSDSPWLSRLFAFMIQWVPSASSQD